MYRFIIQVHLQICLHLLRVLQNIKEETELMFLWKLYIGLLMTYLCGTIFFLRLFVENILTVYLRPRQ